MALLLNIDTATELASVCIARDGNTIAFASNNTQHDHAVWIQEAIRNLLKEAGIEIRELEGIGVTAGPGSYTGLRVGMATAKGLCYALHIPLISESTLEVMAFAAKEQWISENGHQQLLAAPLIAPMIDARRMEVFTALYDFDLHLITPPVALILDPSAFNKELENNSILFPGNGSAKWKSVCDHPNAIFPDAQHSAEHLAKLAERSFLQEKFADLAYEEPAYTKEFYTYMKK